MRCWAQHAQYPEQAEAFLCPSLARRAPITRAMVDAHHDCTKRTTSSSITLTLGATAEIENGVFQGRPILAQAAELAIRQQTECITLDLIEQAANFGIYKHAPVESETQHLQDVETL